jgi:bla regulator protein blaR1
MSVLIAIALKSLLVSGLTLGLLALLKHRSAAERSWVAHIGLLALVIMAFAPLALPRWNVETPTLFAPAPAAIQATAAPSATATPARPSVLPVAPAPAAAAASRMPAISASAAASAIYAVPAVILLFITFLALARLLALRARAEVLVDGHWLTALARAQKRMGFKHGTALLTSNALASPVSWGLVRPVILLNARAVEASNEAEAILAHELAHVARMDWAKLLLARVATALFWFNPLVWVLAREAHQLREETADDAVLAADIADTDYAQLLVGVARHECPGLLLGAHGVAPSKSSLARRVARVLDGKSVRGPVARGFAVGVFAGAVLVAAPLAALTLTPGGPTLAKPLSANAGGSPRYYGRTVQVADVPADLPHIIASGVSTSVATAAAAMAPVRTVVSGPAPISMVDANGNRIVSKSNGETILRSANGTIIVSPPDSSGRRRAVLSSPEGTLVSYLAPGVMPPMPPVPPTPPARQRSTIDRAMEMKAVGITPEYIAAMRAASPALRSADLDDMMGLKSLGVTPAYVRELASAGFSDLGVEDIEQVYAVGLTADYMRRIRSTGVRVSLKDMMELKSMNITPEELAGVKAGPLSEEKIRELAGRRPPRPPPPPGDSDDD